jgi:DNA-binding beta-propeller fold protein YncE
MLNLVSLLVGVVLLLSLASLVEAQSLRSPVRIAFSLDGNLLVTDYTQQMIFTLNRSTLEILEAFAVEGRPTAVAQWGSRLYVGNKSTGSVEVYDLTKKNEKRLFNLGEKNVQGLVSHAADIAIDAIRNLVFVVDAQEKVVKVFDTNGPLLDTISGPDQLILPTGIALDRYRERVLITDYGPPSFSLARVHIYDYFGNFIRLIDGNRGTNVYSFSRPHGLAVDEFGHVFVVDSALGQVLVFDQDTGEGLKIIGSFGSGPGQLYLPLDVVVDDSSKDVFVTNNRLRRLEVFKEGGLIP